MGVARFESLFSITGTQCLTDETSDQKYKSSGLQSSENGG